jgi:acetyl-CoA acyltransferase
MKNARRTYVVGVGMTKFEKPGTKEGDYHDWAREAGTAALADAGISYEEVEQAYAGYVYGESCAGHRAVYELGMSGIPVFNVNSNCSTGSSALYLAAQAIRGGLADCTLALGFEKMQRGSLGATFTDREMPIGRHAELLAQISEVGMPPAPWMFGAAGREHMAEHGSEPEHFAKIGKKNHEHSQNNPNAQFQVAYTLEEIMDAPVIYEPLTKLQCSPTSDGSAAAILASEDFVDRHGLADRAVEIVGQALVTDYESSLASRKAKDVIGYDMNVQAARAVYDQSGLGPEDFQVIELHDCFSANELLLYEALGLAEEGEAPRLVDDGATTYGGKWVVNPSGGLISKGHPLGATGLAQCAELVWQLRGEAGKRQVEGARVGLSINQGLFGHGSCVIVQR